jgi:DNA (cytosine-5)-methyltransferase 1
MDLFCGAGGMSIGLEQAGFKVAYAVEINKDAASTYRHNFPHVYLENKDIRSVDFVKLNLKLKRPRVNLIAAGIPCQGFSIAGRRNPRDPRNQLYKQVLRFVEKFKPEFVVIENVVGMLHAAKGRFVKRIESSLRDLGYTVDHRILSASSYGVPQKRKRLFIIGTLLNLSLTKLFPRSLHTRISASQALSDLSFLGVGATTEEYRRPPRSVYQRLMRANSPLLSNHESPKHSHRIQRLFASIPPGFDAHSVFGKNYSGKRVRVKLDPTKRSITLTTLPEDVIHYRQNRILTVREMARLQSFPDDFIFLGPRTTGGLRRKHSCPQYTQVGNAIPPLLAGAVMTNLVDLIGRKAPSFG